jgi:hypothetical protein
VVTFRHRWWLLCKGLKTPDDTASSSAGAATDLSTFHYVRDIIQGEEEGERKKKKKRRSTLTIM